jgi:hypothetical protein
MLLALKVCIANSNPSKQASFIQDEKDYFRVLCTFDDGVQILRDKYINGQSLYEMYKDNECIFSTKSGNALTRVTEVPKPIAEYLGLIMYDGVCLNARACFEKQIGVQTTGSENYKMFNTVLKSEEIATAGTLLNNDKNSLSADINATDNELQSYKNLLGTNAELTQEMIDYLKTHDSLLDTALSEEEYISKIVAIINNINSIPDIPEVPILDVAQLSELQKIQSLWGSLDTIVIPPEVSTVDDKQLTAIYNIINTAKSLETIVIPPELSTIELDRLNTLQAILHTVREITECDNIVKDADARIEAINAELESLQIELENHGVKMVKCPGCGQIFNPEEAHVH